MGIGLLLHMHGVAILSMLIQRFRIIMQCSKLTSLPLKKYLSNSEYLVISLTLSSKLVMRVSKQVNQGCRQGGFRGFQLNSFHCNDIHIQIFANTQLASFPGSPHV